MTARSHSPTNSVLSDDCVDVGEDYAEDGTVPYFDAENALSAPSATTECDQPDVGFVNAEDWINKPIVEAELDFTMPFVHEMEKMFRNWSKLTKREKDVLIEALRVLLSVLSLDTLMTTQPTIDLAPNGRLSPTSFSNDLRRYIQNNTLPTSSSIF